jgi:hypothetical protein
MKYYSGVGSRGTPPEILDFMTDIAHFLSETGYILRSGGAPGADTAFEAGVPDPAKKEIYLPWKDFNGNGSSRFRVTDEALKLASEFHPAWDKLSYGARKLMGRNGYQVLGFRLLDPVEFVVCWTKGGKETGGTAQAIKIAKSRRIPVYNLFFEEHRNHIGSWITNKKVVVEPA